MESKTVFSIFTGIDLGHVSTRNFQKSIFSILRVIRTKHFFYYLIWGGKTKVNYVLLKKIYIQKKIFQCTVRNIRRQLRRTLFTFGVYKFKFAPVTSCGVERSFSIQYHRHLQYKALFWQNSFNFEIKKKQVIVHRNSNSNVN